MEVSICNFCIGCAFFFSGKKVEHVYLQSKHSRGKWKHVLLWIEVSVDSLNDNIKFYSLH